MSRYLFGSRLTLSVPHPPVRRSIGWLALFLWGLALPWAGLPGSVPPASAGSGRLPVLRPVSPRASQPTPDQIELLRRRNASERRVYEELGPHGVSLKGLQRRAQRLLVGKTAADGPDTLKVLLVRIAFGADRSGSLTSVTENGGFLCDPDPDIQFDPPPHNRAYFEAHLQGLAEYWGSMSQGQLVIESQVLPAGPDCSDAYLLGDIADYGPGSGGFWQIEDLVRLVQDMIRKTDEATQVDGSVNLADFDDDDPNTYVIFAHSGGSLQSNLVFTEGVTGYSPNDIPTFFVQLGFDDEIDDRVFLTSLDSETQEPGRLSEVSVVSESTSQDGLLGSLGADLYHEFGHALGLPDLYSTFTGLPAVGFWDLMGVGTNLGATVQFEEDGETFFVIGLLPPSVSIWCKWFLGWVDPIRIGGERLLPTVAATHLQEVGMRQGSKAVLLDVGSDEFYLLENRSIPATAELGWGMLRDADTGVALYLADAADENTHQYDFFMPWPGGLLIWRIRQDLIDERIEFNFVQPRPRERGITLVEADGLQDIGVSDFFTIGFVGSETDAFRSGSVFDLDDDGETDVEYIPTATEFTPNGIPSSASSIGGAYTGATVRGIPASSDAMKIEAVIQGGLSDDGGPGFPVWLPTVAGATGDVPLRGDGESVGFFRFDVGDAVLVAAAPADGSTPGAVYAYTPGGAPRFGNDARLLELDAQLSGPPAWATDVGGSQSVLFLATRSGSLHAVTTRGPVGNFVNQLPNFPASFGVAVTDGPRVLQSGNATFAVAANLETSTVAVVGTDGIAHPEWSERFPGFEGADLRSLPTVCDLDGDGLADELAYVSGDRLWGAEVSGEQVPGVAVTLINQFPEESEQRFWVVAWPEAGQPDRLVVLSAFGKPWVVAQEGSTWEARELGTRLLSEPLGEPALGDVNGDGTLEVILADGDRVTARSLEGAPLSGFPVEVSEMFFAGEDLPDSSVTTPILADVTGDGIAEVVYATRYGLVHALTGRGEMVPGYPRKYSGGGVVAPLVADLDGRRGLFLFESLGDSIPRGGLLRPGRLAGARLPASVDPAERGAEWIGRGGNLARSGRAAVGVARASADDVFALDFRPLVYPNPVGGSAFPASALRVRFYSPMEQIARIRVFTLEGELMEDIQEAVAGGAVCEVECSTARMRPGAYICRLEYVGPRGRASEMLPFFVER